MYRFQLLGGISRRRTPIRSWEKVLGRLPESARTWNPDRQFAFFFADLRPIGGVLRQIAPDACTALQHECDRIRKGSFRLWEDGYHELGFPPEWNRNPLTGRSLPAGRHWTAIDEQSAGDIKGVWELSRFGPAFRLARWYAAAGEERAAEVFWQLTESWLAANPPNAGPQWISAQEAALRAMAWIFALHAFARSPATTPERAGRLIAALDAHARRIEATLAYAKAQHNNHLISEACGLFTIGLLFPQLPKAVHRRSLGRSLLESTAGQFFPDGGYIQHSMNYHRLALQLYLWAMRLAEIHSQPFSSAMYSCVDRSMGLLSGMVDPQTGRMPNFGHNDGTLFLALNGCDYEDYRPLLQTLFLWRKHARLWDAGPWDEDAIWLLGPDVLNSATQSSIGNHHETEKFISAPRAGLFILRGTESRAVIRGARFRERPAHADQLHVDLWWRGGNIACDAGTYLYGGDPPWCNSFRHAAVHNTVTIDGVDQMRAAGRFGWASLAQGRGAFTGQGRWQGSHDGYQRMGVFLARTVEYWNGDIWIIMDEISGTGPHTARLHWLVPDYPWESMPPEEKLRVSTELQGRLSGLKAAYAGWKFRTPDGDISLRIGSDREAQWSIYRAGELVGGPTEIQGPIPVDIRGWRSIRYANRMPALSLAGVVKGALPIRLVSVWILCGH